MPNWFFPRRRARNAQIEARIAKLLEEAANTPQIQLARAAFRLQRQLMSDGFFLSFEQAFYRLQARDREGVFLRQ